MSRRIDRECGQATDVVGVAILEKPGELWSISLEFRAFVEHFAKGVLHDGDLIPDPNLPSSLD